MKYDQNLIQSLYDAIPEYQQFKYTAFLKESEKGDKRLRENPSLLMIMWLFSVQYDAEQASRNTLKFEKKLGSCEMSYLAQLSLEEIEHAVTNPSSLCRYPKKSSLYIHEMAQLIVRKYYGKPENIWKDASSTEITRRLREIKGFGPKLSSMVPINLVRNFGMEFSDRASMNIAVDIHVEEVLKATGLCPLNASKQEMIDAAREMASIANQYAADLDLPLWATGRFFCNNKKCLECPLDRHCPKIPTGSTGKTQNRRKCS